MPLTSKVSRPRLARVLRVHQQHGPVGRQLTARPDAGGRSEPSPWPALWLLGAGAGIGLPLVLPTLPETLLSDLSRGLGRPAAGSGAGAAARLGIRQAGPLPLLSTTTPSPTGHRAPSPADPLMAVFSGLPSPFADGNDRDAAPLTPSAGPSIPAVPMAGPFPAPGTGTSQLGEALTLADRVTAPLDTFQRTSRQGRPIEADTTDPLPQRWSDHLRALVRNTPLVLPVAVVRVQSPDVQDTRTIPMAVWPDGSATTNVASPGPVGQRLAQDWVRQQTPLSEGSVRPVLMVLEPVPTATVSTAAAPGATDTAPTAAAPETPAPAAQTAMEPAAAAAPAPAPAPEPVSPEAAGGASELDALELSYTGGIPIPMP